MVDKKDKRAAKGALKLKKKKLKERGSFDQLTEVCRTSDSKDNLKIMKEDKPIKTDKEKKRRKSDSKKTIEKEIDVDVKNVQLPCKDLHKMNGKNSGRIVGHGHAKKSIHSKMFDISDSAEFADANIGTKMKSKKSKKDGKRKRKDLHTANESKMEESRGEVDAEKVDQISSACSRRMKKKSKKDGNRKRKDLYIAKERETEESQSEVDAEKVDQISSVDEDCSRGMKKWLIQYKESRPGLKILQQRIDDFMTAYEAQQEQERKEREASAAEGGWTVVVHHKGRKKTTDSESGIAVGSVAQAAVMDKMSKKKSKEVGLDFYRFQRREAKRNEIMMLRSKFEQDKKRIQQLRAARKFRPY